MDSSARNEPLPPRAVATPALQAAERSAQMSRSLTLLFGAGAALCLTLFFALPHPEANVAGLLAVIAAGFAATAGLFALGDRIPAPAYPWLVTLGTLLITAGIMFRGEPTAPHALFY